MLQVENTPSRVLRNVPLIGPDIVGKVELCQRLGWNRMRLDRRLQADPRFPVLYRGGTGKGRGWQFDFDAVKTYLDGRDLTPEESEISYSHDPSLNDPIDHPDTSYATSGPIYDVREHTARSRRENAQAALMEDKLRQSRGDLIQVSELRDVLSTMIAHLGKGLDGLPDQIVEHLNLAAEHTGTIREMINRLRTSMVTDLSIILNKNA